MGALANTRWSVILLYTEIRSSDLIFWFSLGDLRFKKYGVTPEPQVQTKLLDGAAL